ncbi:cellulose binding domain-containing protein [Glycomyces sp. NRRL B-16210]|uniref:cellulose binding domain-containing protein n=1 Tax=Glycomyces sp. NRRL B-16210 TaxID=1463821 RepID=UPI0004BE7781|nr:cellulose binding domain-containing protein [Glycomyces sp. NRRL B-16210]
MGRHHSPTEGGRLHGRLLQGLGMFSAVVALLALWQFGVFGDDPEREPVGTIEGPDTAWQSAEEESPSSTYGPAASADSAPVPTPESSPEPTTEAPAETTTSASPPASTTGAVEEAATVACSVTLTLNQEWNRSIGVTVDIVNTGNVAIDSWEIDLDIDDLDIGHYWGMRERRGDWYANESWNGRLEPGENTVVGFQGEVRRGFELPSSVTCSTGR